MKARAPIWRKLVEEHLAKGMSHREVAEALALPKGTVATWSRRKKADMKADMKAEAPKETGRAMKADMKAEGPAMFRGITARDMPGRTREIQSLNFAAMKRGTYPPRSWGIPGWMQGAELVEAMRKACEKWKKPRSSP